MLAHPKKNAGCGATAPIPSQNAHGRVLGLSKQRFQRAFMPQCRRLRAMGVCGFQPTDPPPQKIEEEMIGRASQSSSRRHPTLYHSLTILVLIAIPSIRLLTRQLVVPQAGLTMTVTASNAIEPIPILKIKVAVSNAIPG